MLRHLRLVGQFMRASAQEALAYRTNFLISLLNSLLTLVTGVLGLLVLFSQIQSLRGWDFASTLALLGVFLTITALRGLFLGPSLEALVGMDGEVWTGRFDYTLLRPVNVQFIASTRHWRPFALLDLAFGLAVLLAAALQMTQQLSLAHVAAFLAALTASVVTLYALLLAFATLVFWSPGFLFTWVFDWVLQMARYPVGLYPGWLRLVLTWVVPVGLMTTLPAQALTGQLPPGALPGALAVSIVLVIAASRLFNTALRRYASASS